MQQLLALLVFLTIALPLSAQPDTVSETPAEFPGGMDSLLVYFRRNVIYPAAMTEFGIEGKCYLSFSVTEEGKVTDIKVLRGVRDCPECDREAIRLFHDMPAWIPAKKGGVPVPSTYRIPVIFRMD